MGAFVLPSPRAVAGHAGLGSKAQCSACVYTHRRAGRRWARRKLLCQALQVSGAPQEAVISFGEALFGE